MSKGATPVVQDTKTTSGATDPEIKQNAKDFVTTAKNEYMPGGQVKPLDDAMRPQVAGFSDLQNKSFQTVGSAPDAMANVGKAQGMADAQAGQQFDLNQHVDPTHVGAFGSPDGYRQFMSPYTQEVTNRGIADINRNFGQQQAGLDASAGSSGAFGGSRHALQEGLLREAQGKAVGDFSAQQNAAAYNNAVNQFNQQNNTNMGLAGQQMQAFGVNTGEQQRQLGNELNLAGAGTDNAAKQAQLQFSTGQQQQNQEQAQLDAAQQWAAAKYGHTMDIAGQLGQLNAGAAPINGMTTTGSSVRTGGPSKASGLIGPGIQAGASLGAAALPLRLSDVRAKEGIDEAESPEQTLGAFKATPVSEWNYTPEAQDELGVDGQRHMGAMAQDIGQNFGEEAAPTDPETGAMGIDIPTMLGKIMNALKGLEERTAHLAPEPDREEAA